MSNSNYSIGLQRLKPVHTVYGAICMPIRKLSWARDVNGRDRHRDETETLTIFLETRPRRDVGTSRDRLETETSTPRPQPCLSLKCCFVSNGTRCTVTPCSATSMLNCEQPFIIYLLLRAAISGKWAIISVLQTRLKVRAKREYRWRPITPTLPVPAPEGDSVSTLSHRRAYSRRIIFVANSSADRLTVHTDAIDQILVERSFVALKRSEDDAFILQKSFAIKVVITKAKLTRTAGNLARHCHLPSHCNLSLS